MRPKCVFAASIAAAAALALPPPAAYADQSAAETIGLLESAGYMVNVDRVGNAPLDQCTVTSVRNPQQVTRWVRVSDDGWGKHGQDDELVEIVISQSISVSLDCTH